MDNSDEPKIEHNYRNADQSCATCEHSEIVNVLGDRRPKCSAGLGCVVDGGVCDLWEKASE